MQTRMYTYTIAEKWSSSEIHSMYALLQLELLKTLSNAGFPKCLAAYTRLQLIVESFRPIDFHETDARLYYHHVQLERLLVTRFSSCSPFLPTGYSLNFRAFRYLSLSLSLSLLFAITAIFRSSYFCIEFSLSLFFFFFFFFFFDWRIWTNRFAAISYIQDYNWHHKISKNTFWVSQSRYVNLPSTYCFLDSFQRWKLIHTFPWKENEKERLTYYHKMIKVEHIKFR